MKRYYFRKSYWRGFSTYPHLFNKLESGNMVFIQGAAATPNVLVNEFVAAAKERNLRDLRTCHLHLSGPGPLPDEESSKHIRPLAFFVGENLRGAVNQGLADYLPVFLYEVPLLFEKKAICPDISLVQVSPPDKHGYCSLGTSIDVTTAAIRNSKYVIGQVNEYMPRTLGDGIVHVNQFDELIFVNERLPCADPKLPTAEEKKIGQLIAEHLVEDGATLQMGIGSIPDAVLSCLSDHKDLGVHTEMFSDGVLELVEKGVITNKWKKVYKGKIVSSFVVGSQRLYEFLDDNQSVIMLGASYVNNPSKIKHQPKMTAINSCVEIDLTGQVCSDSIGHKIYSGFGGQVDFIRGASICPDGKPIVALTSRTAHGKSKISASLTPGAGVVTSRAHVHYVVTEFGIVNLFGKSIRERARSLISIAHPDDRLQLEREAAKFNLL